jgi:protease I
MKRHIGIMLAISLMFFGSLTLASAASPFLDVAKSTGIQIVEEGGATIWKGPVGGKIKPNGPLAGKKIGLLVACEFSDWQAYYLAEYVAEFGGTPQFIMNNNHLWKNTRPMNGIRIPRGTWGLTLTEGMDGLGINGNRTEYPVVLKEDPNLVAPGVPGKGTGSLKVADPAKYDALIILGSHSGDILVADDVALNFIKAVAGRGVPIAGIGAGIMPMIHLGLMNGKKAVGNRTVDYMLRKIAVYSAGSVAVDGKIITGRDTYSTPGVLRALCKVMDPSFVDKHKDILKGKTVMAMTAEDWEDIELCAPTMELMYRGANIVVGLFDPIQKARPAMLDSDVRTGSFGTTVPFQEIPESYYKIIKVGDLNMSDFDALWIHGAMNPWRLTVGSEAQEFLRDAYAFGKIIAAICHGPIPLAAAGILQGKRSAGWLASEDSVKIMGGIYNWDWSAVIDGRVVTGRIPMDAPEFVDAITESLLR